MTFRGSLLLLLPLLLQGCREDLLPPPLLERREIQLALLLEDVPWQRALGRCVARECRRRQWSHALWFAADRQEQKMALKQWQKEPIVLALISSPNEEIGPDLAAWQSQGKSLALLGEVDEGQWSSFPCFLLAWEEGVRQAASQGMKALREAGVERPLFLYLGRPGEAGRRALARRLFAEGAQGGQVEFLLTAEPRREAKQRLKAWLAGAPKPFPKVPMREVHLLFAEDEELTLALLDAMTETGFRPLLAIGSGLRSELVEALYSGRLDALLAFAPRLLAFQIAEWVSRRLAGEDTPPPRLSPSLFTSEQVDALTEQIALGE